MLNKFIFILTNCDCVVQQLSGAVGFRCNFHFHQYVSHCDTHISGEFKINVKESNSCRWTGGWNVTAGIKRVCVLRADVEKDVMPRACQVTFILGQGHCCLKM